MIIRNICEEDIKSCLDIYNYYIENTSYTFEEEKLELSAFTERVKTITNKFPYIVAENDQGKVVGYAYLSEFISRSACRITADLSIYVSLEHTRENVGGILLDSIEALARDIGILNIISVVTSSNVRSCNFHLKHGFILEGVVHDIAIKFGELQSVNYYRKHLD